MNTVTPVRAVVHGHLTITLPVFGVIGLFGLLGWYLFGFLTLILGLFVGGMIAWPVWSFLVPRWRDWVEDHGLKGEDVETMAVATGLLWPKGFPLEKTEFRRRNGKRGW